MRLLATTRPEGVVEGDRSRYRNRSTAVVLCAFFFIALAVVFSCRGRLTRATTCVPFRLR